MGWAVFAQRLAPCNLTETFLDELPNHGDERGMGPYGCRAGQRDAELVGVMGTLQAVEVLKEITGAGDSLAGKLTIYDALGGRFQSIRLKWDPKNPLSGKHPTVTDLSVHAAAQ